MRKDSPTRGVSLDTIVPTTNKTQYINHPLGHIISLKLKDTQQSKKRSKFLTIITLNPPSEAMNQDLDVLAQ